MQQSSRLAIYALIELAGNLDRQISAAEIGEKYRVSAHHLAKVLMTLGRAGLVQSTRGVGGGYSFSGNTKRLTLLDIIGLFEDTSTACKLSDPSQATSEEWALYAVTKEIEQLSLATYGSITIATMLKQIERLRQAQASRRQTPQVSPAPS